jgi:hypothetical protein
MIAEVYFWTDDSKVTVFDERGHQMPDYGGPIGEVAALILKDAPPSASFYLANLAVGSKDRITRADFADLSK